MIRITRTGRFSVEEVLSFWLIPDDNMAVWLVLDRASCSACLMRIHSFQDSVRPIRSELREDEPRLGLRCGFCRLGLRLRSFMLASCAASCARHQASEAVCNARLVVEGKLQKRSV